MASNVLNGKGLFVLVEKLFENPEKALLLREMMCKNGIIYVDNSGSTLGPLLKIAQMGVTELGPKWVVLWNSVCGPASLLEDIHWESRGGTAPSQIFKKHQPENYSTFILITDGDVLPNEVARLAEHAPQTAHLPHVLAIVSVLDDTEPISRLNVSVLQAHYECALCAVLIVMGPGSIRVLAAKGPWSHVFGPLPDLSGNPHIGVFPPVSVNELLNLSTQKFAAKPPHSIQVKMEEPNEGGSEKVVVEKWMLLSQLQEVRTREEVEALAEMLSASDMEQIVREFYLRGRDEVKKLRQWLTSALAQFLCSLNGSLNEVATEQEEEANSDCAYEETPVWQLLQRLQEAKTKAEKKKVREELFGRTQAARLAGRAATYKVKSRFHSTRAFLNEGLRMLADLERVGSGANSLGRMSNRAQRADKVREDDIRPMVELDELNLTVKARCDVMFEEHQPCALLLKNASELEAGQNTTDCALNFTFAHGSNPYNHVFEPFKAGITDNTADKLEALGVTPLRNKSDIAMPVVPLRSKMNQEQVYLRLCVALMARKRVSKAAVWQLALATITHTLATKQWAAPGTDIHRLLYYFGDQILTHVQVHKSFRQGEMVPLREALAHSIASELFTVHYPMEGTAMALMIMHVWGVPIGPQALEAATGLGPPTALQRLFSASVSATQTSALAVAIARLHAYVVQNYRKELVNSSDPQGLKDDYLRIIYNVHKGSTSVSAIAGEHQLPECLMPPLVSPRVLEALDLLIAHMDLDCSSEHLSSVLIVPALALVVQGCLLHVNANHTSTSAIDACAKHQDLAAEFNYQTVGLLPREQVLAKMRSYLSWAISPPAPLAPFASVYGPSVIYFYHTMTQKGRATNMLAGYEGAGDESPPTGKQLKQIEEHLKEVKAKLLENEYSSAKGCATISQPLHRQMWMAWALDGVHPTDSKYIATVIRRIVDGGTGNRHARYLRREVAMLVPSLLNVGEVNRHYKGNRVPFIDRLRLELAGRSVAEMLRMDPPEAVWYENHELEVGIKLPNTSTKLRLANYDA